MAKAYEKARYLVAKLKAEQRDHSDKAAVLEAGLVVLESKRGAVLLDGGDLAALGREIVDAKHLASAERSAAVILAGRVTEAEAAQRQAVASELRVRSVKLAGELEKREADFTRLFRQLEAIDGENCILRNPERSKMVRDKHTIEMLWNAADMVGRGLKCPIARETGQAYDAELW